MNLDTRANMLEQSEAIWAKMPSESPEAIAKNTGETDEERQSQSSLIVQFVESRCRLFHDENKDVYARDRETKEVRQLGSRSFKDWLHAAFYREHKKTPRDQALREALSTLSGIGRHNGELKAIHKRVAYDSGCYYVDLAEPGENRAICIEAGDWEIIKDPPVMFVRSESMQPLPYPEKGGNIDDLWEFVNVKKEDRVLVLAWLLESMRPDTPFPLLELIGEQGSAKSTTQTILRRLLDPNTCDLRAAPKTIDDISVGAGVSWLVSYENISHLSTQMQDALCVLATGGGFAKRKLYSDAEESIIKVKRPIVLNGISAAITNQDLIDRTVSIETPIITQRIESGSIWPKFEATRPKYIGVLCETMSKALAILPTIEIPAKERPRLIEFARFGMAVAQAIGEPANSFLVQFNASRQESISRTIDASSVATAVMGWIESHPQGATASVKDFMDKVGPYKPSQCDTWPRTAKGFGDQLRRLAPALRQLGIECRCLGKVGGSVRWTVESISKGETVEF